MSLSASGAFVAPAAPRRRTDERAEDDDGVDHPRSTGHSSPGDTGVIINGVAWELWGGPLVELTIESVADKAQAVCKMKNWSRGWSNGGCYLHLEVSEFIEALRGKGDERPDEEAADILFVLLSMLRGHDISPTRVLEILDAKCDEILEGRRTFKGDDA